MEREDNMEIEKGTLIAEEGVEGRIIGMGR